MTPTRRRVLGALVAAPAAPAVARASTVRRWRCVTSWSRNLPGPGVSAQRLAERINAASGGEIRIEVFAAGEIVPALAAFEAVSRGTVEMAHTAALFWQGKIPAAPAFTTLPFGLGPNEHLSWLAEGGQALWDEVYGAHGVKPLVGGNTGPSTAGWFRKPIGSPGDLAGLRIRVTGFGAQVYARLGAVPLALAPGETHGALERGAIDAAEFLAPVNDLSLGLERIAPNLAYPGFNKPNGVSELLIGRALWEGLPAALRQVVEAACLAEHALALAEAEAANATALATLVSRGAKLTPLPASVVEAAHKAAGEVIDALATADPLARRAIEGQRRIARTGKPWQQFLSGATYALAGLR
jgi:TRAP-type mannitol/chloroaromatic compound transport system substrate-binding protein